MEFGMMKKSTTLLHKFLLISVFLSFITEAKQVTDQLNRQVTIPDKVERVVILQHQTLNLVVQLNRQDTIVGVLSSWQKLLGKNYISLAPNLANMPMPGDITSVNIESLIALKPQVIFVANYAPKEMIEQIEKLNIPVIAISLRKDVASQADKINPVMIDEETTYNEGLKEGISLIGEVLNAQNEAKKLNRLYLSTKTVSYQPFKNY